MKLTVRQVETVKPQDKDFKLSDGGGLYLLVKTTGSKYWRLKYRTHCRKRKITRSWHFSAYLSGRGQKKT